MKTFRVGNGFPISSSLFTNKQELEKCRAQADGTHSELEIVFFIHLSALCFKVWNNLNVNIKPRREDNVRLPS